MGRNAFPAAMANSGMQPRKDVSHALVVEYITVSSSNANAQLIYSGLGKSVSNVSSLNIMTRAKENV
jgi:hypothetical protein